MIYVTGDIHGGFDIHKLSSKELRSAGLRIKKDDYVIVCGDFGLVWDNKPEERYWRKWFDEKPWTTLFVDGNHENFELLNTYSVEEWHGGRIHRISEKTIHLMRGNVFSLEGASFFTFGGAASHDKEWRLPVFRGGQKNYLVMKNYGRLTTCLRNAIIKLITSSATVRQV